MIWATALNLWHAAVCRVGLQGCSCCRWFSRRSALTLIASARLVDGRPGRGRCGPRCGRGRVRCSARSARYLRRSGTSAAGTAPRSAAKSTTRRRTIRKPSRARCRGGRDLPDCDRSGDGGHACGRRDRRRVAGVSVHGRVARSGRLARRGRDAERVRAFQRAPSRVLAHSSGPRPGWAAPASVGAHRRARRAAERRVGLRPSCTRSSR